MECSVCYSDTVTTCKLMCGHSFCVSCIKQWYLKSDEETTCPMCRKKLYFKGMHKYCEKWEEERYKEKTEEIFANLFDQVIEQGIMLKEFDDDEDEDDDYLTWLILHDLGVMEYFFNKNKDMDWEHWEDFEDAVNDEVEYSQSRGPYIYYELLMKNKSLLKFSKVNSKRLPNIHTIFV